MPANSDITIYKQIYPIQCPTLVQLGYCSVINIRPDGECETQPSSDELATAAEQTNLAYVYLPYDCDRLSRQTIEAFAKHYHALPKPIMLFCGTGNRAKLLYQSALMQGLL
ncbi:beta-lactamase hydrolase domain-containing protein [Psychrobacter sp. I-STPA10]|uniref:beta-lactamase hydrolase domain-containing protein n=1 Tax=Psychrobacter sp. I-STPA10 TaxID=2585769 RepID=UPI001E49A710|nr:sulfur transferase domain-containing protein [Psychrobacter sp. I-STPA10]